MPWLQRIFKFREESDGDTVKPFLEHLEEMRWTIIRMAIVQVVTMVLAFYFRADLMNLLRAPLMSMHPVPKLITSGIVDSFVISMELSFFAGLALALPFHIYSAASYIFPALTRKERACFLPAIASGFVFFLGGLCMAYWKILPATLNFFWNDAQKLILDPLWTWRAYFSFSAWLCVGFGAMCEIPVVVVVLALLGFVNFRLLRRTRPYAYTIILFLSAIVAPSPDPVMFFTLAMPILLMYEACIWIVWSLDRRKANPELLAALLLVGMWRRKALSEMHA